MNELLRFSDLRTTLPRTILSLLLAGIASLLLANSASAVVTRVGSVEVGLQPRSTTLHYGLTAGKFANPDGNPVLPSSKTYTIFWDPTDHYHGDWQHLIDGFLHNAGSENDNGAVFSVEAQYTDAANQHALYKMTFMGGFTDTDAYPASGCEDPDPYESGDLIGPEVGGEHTPVCLTDQQVREEIAQFISQHALPKGMGSIFYLMTPPGVTVCLGGGGTNGHCSDYEASAESYKTSFCSYHSDVNPTENPQGDANTILYAVVPWIAGGAGDGQLSGADRSRPAYDCQDGGFDPSSQPSIEEPESPPHIQEPNQGTCPSPDGFCDTGLADLIVNQIAVEQQNTVTNPLLHSWQDSAKNEDTDECRNYFAAGGIQGGSSPKEETQAGDLSNQEFVGTNYYLNDSYNLSSALLVYPGIPCLPGIRLEPGFTTPNTVAAGELVDFDGMESDITLNAGTAFTAGIPHTSYATYTWEFGDGSPAVTGYAPGGPLSDSTTPCTAPWEAPCAASVFHSYQYGGTYNVTLTVTDVGGYVASSSQTVNVTGPSAPSAPSGGASISPGGALTGSGASGGSSTTGTGAAKAEVTAAPVISGLVESKSLKKVLHSGLAIRYSVNEQVAGGAQVILDSATAKRLGIRGTTATGLPKGSPRSIVIGTAVLVTTKAGKGTIRVKFSKPVASHLAQVRKLKLMLRLSARNASRQSPRSTTVISTVVLSK